MNKRKRLHPYLSCKQSVILVNFLQNADKEICVESNTKDKKKGSTWQSLKNAMEFHWLGNSIFLLFCSSKFHIVAKI